MSFWSMVFGAVFFSALGTIVLSGYFEHGGKESLIGVVGCYGMAVVAVFRLMYSWAVKVQSKRKQGHTADLKMMEHRIGFWSEVLFSSVAAVVGTIALFEYSRNGRTVLLPVAIMGYALATVFVVKLVHNMAAKRKMKQKPEDSGGE